MRCRCAPAEGSAAARARLSGGTWAHIAWQYRGDRRETYSYNPDGTIDQIHVAQSTLEFVDGSTKLDVGGLGAYALLSDHSYDFLGRLTRQLDYLGGVVAYDRSVSYNGKRLR